MSGQIIETEAHDIYEKGRKEGIEKGIEKGREEGVDLMTPEEIARYDEYWNELRVYSTRNVLYSKKKGLPHGSPFFCNTNIRNLYLKFSNCIIQLFTHLRQ